MLSVLLLAILSLAVGGNYPSANMKAVANERSIKAAATDIKISSSVFQEGQTIPKLYTADGQNISPPLRWQEVPTNAMSFVLICDDPDAPMGTWVHWLVYNIPPDQRELPAAVSAQANPNRGLKQGTNSFGRIGYGGPAPPRGKAHRYYFKIYALDTVLQSAPGINFGQLQAAMMGHILAQGQLMAKYSR
jgi:Raf kinase inhibitor-like YbhB/YbcL family protein